MFLSLAACQSTGHASRETAQNRIHLTGNVIIRDLPPQRTSLYIEAQPPGHYSTETSTSVSGRFSVSLPSGTYILKALPKTACPIRNTLILPPAPKTVRIALTTSPLTFIHCQPSTLQVLNKTHPVKKVTTPVLRIRGIWLPAPSRPISLFVSSVQSAASVQEIPVGPDGTFSWHPDGPGQYQLQAAPPGLCPLLGTVTIESRTQYLEIEDARLSPGAPCQTPGITAHSGAFSPAGTGH